MLADIKASAMMWRTDEGKGSQNYFSPTVFLGQPHKANYLQEPCFVLDGIERFTPKYGLKIH